MARLAYGMRRWNVNITAGPGPEGAALGIFDATVLVVGGICGWRQRALVIHGLKSSSAGGCE